MSVTCQSGSFSFRSLEANGSVYLEKRYILTSHLLLHVSDGVRKARDLISHLLNLLTNHQILLVALGPQGSESRRLLLLQEAVQNLKLLLDPFFRVLRLVLGRDATGT